MKIAIIGASGKAGNVILEESIERGHKVTAIVRNASKIKKNDVQILEKSVFDLNTEDIKDFDVVVNAFKAIEGQEHQHVEAGTVLIKALQGTIQTRLIVVGGAGSLFVDEAQTTRKFEAPGFPEVYLPTAVNMAKNLNDLQRSTGIQWTYLSPAGIFDPEGRKTGSYQKGGDRVTLNIQGESYISYADYAIALLDEIEHPEHENIRYSVVGER
ncbi:NAD(P)-dependent oxidoreductase [Paenibacillus sp. Aloe-11]|uniref:NAD(P)-dependent oxidoreductase n=1 Tax=Paenibacillus sp. Aloe-11 TaxID=1050222 RepID=UPI00024F058B|nr:NAD(P)-dependent oxidoreductase [Paenibacillus sp. Aloe-11]EHS55465.1 oxidoreductase [Paenibacillus sp. Aloe-11]